MKFKKKSELNKNFTKLTREEGNITDCVDCYNNCDNNFSSGCNINSRKK